MPRQKPLQDGGQGLRKEVATVQGLSPGDPLITYTTWCT